MHSFFFYFRTEKTDGKPVFRNGYLRFGNGILRAKLADATNAGADMLELAGKPFAKADKLLKFLMCHAGLQAGAHENRVNIFYS
jgi:hypothetical protein